MSCCCLTRRPQRLIRFRVWEDHPIRHQGRTTVTIAYRYFPVSPLHIYIYVFICILIYFEYTHSSPASLVIVRNAQQSSHGTHLQSLPTTSRQRNKPLPITLMLSRDIAYPFHTKQHASDQGKRVWNEWKPFPSSSRRFSSPLLLSLSVTSLSLVLLVISLLVFYPLSCFLYWCTYRHSSTLVIKSEAIIDSISCCRV